MYQNLNIKCGKVNIQNQYTNQTQMHAKMFFAATSEFVSLVTSEASTFCKNGTKRSSIMKPDHVRFGYCSHRHTQHGSISSVTNHITASFSDKKTRVHRMCTRCARGSESSRTGMHPNYCQYPWQVCV